jgi:hypothetical protein
VLYIVQDSRKTNFISTLQHIYFVQLQSLFEWDLIDYPCQTQHIWGTGPLQEACLFILNQWNSVTINETWFQIKDTQLNSQSSELRILHTWPPTKFTDPLMTKKYLYIYIYWGQWWQHDIPELMASWMVGFYCTAMCNFCYNTTKQIAKYLYSYIYKPMAFLDVQCPQKTTRSSSLLRPTRWQWERYLYFSWHCSLDNCWKQISTADNVYIQWNHDLM